MPVFVFADAQFFHRVTKFVHYYHCIIIIIQIPEGHAFSKRKLETNARVSLDSGEIFRRAEGSRARSG
jgi:hypothetical protein